MPGARRDRRHGTARGCNAARRLRAALQAAGARGLPSAAPVVQRSRGQHHTEQE
jgi:hypothetical protein